MGSEKEILAWTWMDDVWWWLYEWPKNVFVQLNIFYNQIEYVQVFSWVLLDAW